MTEDENPKDETPKEEGKPKPKGDDPNTGVTSPAAKDRSSRKGR